MKSLRFAATSALACALVLPLVAAAEDAPAPYLTDQSGDANGINGQGLDDSAPELAAAGYDMADLLALSLATISDDGATSQGLEIRLKTGAPLSTAGDNLLIRMYGNVGGCQGQWQIDVRNVVYGDEIDFEWYVEGCGQGTSDDAVIAGITIDNDAWTLEVDEATSEAVITIMFDTLAEMKMDKYLVHGKKITIDSIEVRHVNSEPTGTAPYSIVVPVLDILRNPEFASWRIGEDLPNAVFES